MIKLYFSTVKILAHRPTDIPAVATDNRGREREGQTDKDRETEAVTDRESSIS